MLSKFKKTVWIEEYNLARIIFVCLIIVNSLTTQGLASTVKQNIQKKINNNQKKYMLDIRNSQV